MCSGSYGNVLAYKCTVLFPRGRACPSSPPSTFGAQGTLKFNVGRAYTTWGELFSRLVSIKKKEKLPEFSVGDIPPEEIFVGLSRRQLFFTFRRPRANLSRMPSHVDGRPGPLEAKEK
ncbi:hypothetical protein MRX96_041284 [Rhipicephalus microplus]